MKEVYILPLGMYGGIVATNGDMGTGGHGYICNSYNTGNISGGNTVRAGVCGQVRCRGGNSYIYNCYNRGNTNGGADIVGGDHGGAGVNVQINCTTAADANLENLNKNSAVEQVLIDKGLYDANTWTNDVKNEDDTWKYNEGYPILKWQIK